MTGEQSPVLRLHVLFDLSDDPAADPDEARVARTSVHLDERTIEVRPMRTDFMNVEEAGPARGPRLPVPDLGTGPRLDLRELEIKLLKLTVKAYLRDRRWDVIRSAIAAAGLAIEPRWLDDAPISFEVSAPLAKVLDGL